MNEQTSIETTVGINQSVNSAVHQGMPALKRVKKSVSFFEFWPGFIFYLPVIFQWFWLSVKHKGFSLPLNANPGMTLSGMVGERKSELFSTATGAAKARIAPWVRLPGWDNIGEQLQKARRLMNASGIEYPIVAKPDVGCRGVGVQIVRNDLQLIKYLGDFPRTADVLLQKLVSYEAEAGVFYIRYPGSAKGEVFSLTLKYQPHVIGNGFDTLKTLIESDARARRFKKGYLRKHWRELESVLPAGQPFRLAFAGSHSRGAIFRDGRDFITPELTKSLDEVANGLPEFHYGRFDIRFRDIDSLMNGTQYYILEVNGASSEAAHIWDCGGSLREVFRVLLYQYRTLFHFGDINRRRGFKPPSVVALLKGWWRERVLVRQYPESD